MLYIGVSIFKIERGLPQPMSGAMIGDRSKVHSSLMKIRSSPEGDAPLVLATACR